MQWKVFFVLLNLLNSCKSTFVFTSTAELKAAAATYFAEESSGIVQYGNISLWDVSAIIDFTRIFQNQDCSYYINGWDVSLGRNFGGMFQASTFNSPLSSWDMISATDINNMFQNNKAFNQDLSRWNVSGVASFAAVFQNTEFDRARL